MYLSSRLRVVVVVTLVSMTNSKAALHSASEIIIHLLLFVGFPFSFFIEEI